MSKYCPDSCHKKTFREPAHCVINNETFYELSAKDANGKVRSMEDLEGYVKVLVNAARVCDHSEIFYETLEHLHSIHPYALEILAFPFDHPNIDIDKCRAALETYEKQHNGKVHIMQAVEINGPNTHPVFRYLKTLFDMDEMDNNFAHYFFISPDSDFFELHYGASYSTLKRFVDYHVKNDLGENPKVDMKAEYDRFKDRELRQSVERRSRAGTIEF